MSWEPELPLSASAITIHESAFGNVPERGAQNKSRVDSHNRNEGRFSKLRNGKGIPETQERDPESQQNSCSVEELRKKFEPPALTHGPEKPPQKGSRVDSPKRVQANFSKQSKGNEDPVILERGFFKMQRYKVDVTLNADTAHPRLEVSEDGKSMNDTGVIRQVPSKEERFDSHIFVLAKEGYTSGRKYWEVDVGKRRNWILGVASESVARKGTVNLSPKNGFWVIGLTDGEEYWAHTDPWTRLTASGRPQKIGVFLDISANKLSFYDAKKKSALYTFTSIGDSRLERKFIPFFSTGSGVSALDTEPLKIVQGFDDDD
ncbi:butyrophilin subfamily 1 member A1-like isoform X2 [Centrocercus urophasianus]|uniref:butyrophilin subfamily 1 member A1-like isoform X2 n=1 Tax=Centrocercus urophasianus TaxID=9002 RepID=UPI001C65417B|nr:butyrophilin subfamily 1 member A1-like isoform X2 [Centrocercus urophasianus]